MALKQHRALPGSTDELSEPTTSLPPRSYPNSRRAPGRDAVAQKAHHPTMRPIPASGRFRMNRSRMRKPLVHDRLPYEARDADAVSAAPNDDREGTLAVASNSASDGAVSRC